MHIPNDVHERMVTLSAQLGSSIVLANPDNGRAQGQHMGRHTGDIVNLRTARKRAVRRKAEQTAAENRQAFGVTRKERADASSERDRIDRTLDGHRIEPGDRR
jgi:hypothetical protein